MSDAFTESTPLSNQKQAFEGDFDKDFVFRRSTGPPNLAVG